MIITRPNLSNDPVDIEVPEWAVARGESLPKCAICCYCWESPTDPCWCRLLKDTVKCIGPADPLLPSRQTLPDNPNTYADLSRDSWQMGAGKERDE